MPLIKISKGQINQLMEARLRDYLSRDIHDLEAVGAGDIPYVVRARRYLELYEEQNGAPARRLGDHQGLRLVERLTS